MILLILLVWLKASIRDKASNSDVMLAKLYWAVEFNDIVLLKQQLEQLEQLEKSQMRSWFNQQSPVELLMKTTVDGDSILTRSSKLQRHKATKLLLTTILQLQHCDVEL